MPPAGAEIAGAKRELRDSQTGTSEHCVFHGVYLSLNPDVARSKSWPLFATQMLGGTHLRGLHDGRGVPPPPQQKQREQARRGNRRHHPPGETKRRHVCLRRTR